MTKVLIHTDGGARGNPGPAAAGAVIEIEGKQTTRLHRYLGKATNNQAEYQGVILALEWIVSHIKGPVSGELILDSELVVNQLNGSFRVKHPDLKPLHTRVMTLLGQVGRLSIRSVGREDNQLADQLVNQALDAAD